MVLQTIFNTSLPKTLVLGGGRGFPAISHIFFFNFNPLPLKKVHDRQSIYIFFYEVDIRLL